MSKVWQPTFLEGSLQGVQGTGKKESVDMQNMRVQAPDERHAAGSDSKTGT